MRSLGRSPANGGWIPTEFALADAFELQRLGRRFDSVLDCGLFHVFDSEERQRYAASLASTTDRDAILRLLCFSGPHSGPHPVSHDELRAAFNRDNLCWKITTIEADCIETRDADYTDQPGWQRSNGSKQRRRPTA